MFFLSSDVLLPARLGCPSRGFYCSIYCDFAVDVRNSCSLSTVYPANECYWGRIHHGILCGIAARRLDLLNKAKKRERLPSEKGNDDVDPPELLREEA